MLLLEQFAALMKTFSCDKIIICLYTVYMPYIYLVNFWLMIMIFRLSDWFPKPML